MSQVNVEAILTILTIHVTYPDAREVPKIETRMSKHAEVHQKTYFLLKDKNGVGRIRSAMYIVSSNNPRVLKIMLTKLNNNMKSDISF